METNVFIASDHAGFDLKGALIPYIGELGHTVKDLGPYKLDPEDDYPDFVVPCARLVAATPGSFGIIIGGSGQGEAMAANRIADARAAVFYGPAHALGSVDVEGDKSTDDFEIVRLVRKHNDANILSFGSRFISLEQAKKAVNLFLETPFSHEERHERRVSEF